MKKTLLFALCFAGAIATQVKAQTASLDENFDKFDVNEGLPQKEWSTDSSGNVNTSPIIRLRQSTNNPNNNYIFFYSAFFPNKPVYLFTPKVAASDGTYKIKFLANSRNNQSTTITVCLLKGEFDLEDVTEVKSFSITQGAGQPPYEVIIPKTDRQYIAFKFESTQEHDTCGFDNVVYSSPNMATAEVLAINELVSIATTADQSSLFFATKESAVSEVKILSVNGQVVLTAKPTDNRVNISSLNKGVYIVSTTLANGKTANTKFIKK
ncbi:T9SS type A sorting domain-containing protein [Riemerella columbipharyngis]|uniref:Por secretion system C-terminal sorting domain-containing protein n=1 Tax=Riemerella columbipharyngis TaxID=1071918 RepID=A0A1G7AYD9_9FLAO|nr:T9SS type A sorting domain-containing protein [Riemerella columbipharyngis]SDE19690.1 Por secretion system C-terminal sorting domain-containing protein [Riemerella columbipharyngis]